MLSRMRTASSIIIVAVLAALVSGILLGRYVFPEKVIVRENVAKNEAAETSVNLMLTYGNGIVRTWNTVTIEESTSVLDLLSTVAATGAITIESEAGENGTRLRSVDGVKNSSADGRRWKYWVNNIEEPRAIDKYYLRPGDIVVIAYSKE